MKNLRRLNGRLVADCWSVVDPMSAALSDAMWTARYALTALTQKEAYLILEAASCYLHFASHPASNKSIFSQLAQVRRMVREHMKEDKP